MKKIILTMAAALLTAAQANALPTNVRTLVDKACAQEDEFVAYAIVNTTRQQFPTYQDAIASYWKAGCAMPEGVAPAPDKVAVPVDGTAPALAAAEAESPWSGELETSADIRTGNTEKTNLLLRGKVAYEVEKWRHTLEAHLVSDEEDGTTLEEEYRVGFRSDYKLDARNFLFGELEYVDDRFSGYDYRLSETVGYGRIFYDLDDFYWEGRAGIGMRQDKLTTGQDENSGVITLATDLDWQATDYLSLYENADVSIAQESTIFQSETGLKSKIIDHLAMKAAFYVEHITDVPPDRKDTDTRTTLGVVYDF